MELDKRLEREKAKTIQLETEAKDLRKKYGEKKDEYKTTRQENTAATEREQELKSKCDASFFLITARYENLRK